LVRRARRLCFAGIVLVRSALDTKKNRAQFSDMMNLRTLVAAVTMAMAATSQAAERNLPPHPTLVYAEYKGERHLVVAAEKDKPVIISEGRRVSLPSDTPLITERAPGYSGMAATFKNIQLSHGNLYSGSQRLTGFGEKMTAKIVANQNLTDCFLVLIHFEDEFLMTDAEREISRKKNAEIFHSRPVGKPQIRVQQIENLKADQPVQVTCSSIILLDARFTNLPYSVDVKFQTFLLYPLFSGGQEVKTNQPAISAEYFHHREKMLHSAVLRQWLKQNAKASQPLRPVLQIPPIFESTAGLPTDASATLSVGADGAVSDVTFDREFPSAAEAVLRSALHAWLFLPKIQEGSPVPSRVKLPLRF
jgi:hypothetical protein